MLRVTKQAQDELRRLMRGEKRRKIGVRLFVDAANGSQRDCWILFEEKGRARDRVLIVGDLTILVGPESTEYLVDKELHWVRAPEGKGEFWVNPLDEPEHRGPYPCAACERNESSREEHDEDGDDDEEPVAFEPEKPRRRQPVRRFTAAKPTAAAPRLPKGWRPAP